MHTTLRAALRVALLFLAGFFSANQAHALTIETLAGNGTVGSSGDNAAATSAQVYRPVGVVNIGGVTYIAEHFAHKIRMVSGGTIYTAVGTGTAGFNGDSFAFLSQIYSPFQLSAQDNILYFADRGNHRVRAVGPLYVSTVAGTGTPGYSGDGGAATAAQLSYPEGVAVDAAHNVYIADRDNHVVRRVDGVTGIISTFAGTGVAGAGGASGAATSIALNTPSSVAVHGADVYVADTFNHSVRRISGGVMTRVAGTGSIGSGGDGGPATSAGLLYPYGIAIDNEGRLLIADSFNNRLRRVELDGSINTIAGTGSAGSAGDGGDATLAQLNDPRGVGVDAAGNIYVTEFSGHRVRRIQAPTPVGTPTPSSTITRTGTPTRTFTSSPTVTVSPSESPSFTVSPTFTASPVATATPTFTVSPTHTPTATPSFTISPTPSISATFTVSPTPGRPSAKAGQVFSYPNPVRPGQPITLIFPASLSATIDLHDWSGRKVASIPAGNIQPGSGYAVWNGRDDEGRDLASGLYLIRLQRPEGAILGKLSLRRQP